MSRHDDAVEAAKKDTLHIGTGITNTAPNGDITHVPASEFFSTYGDGDELVSALLDYQRWMKDADGEPSITLSDIDGDETFGAAAQAITTLKAQAASMEKRLDAERFRAEATQPAHIALSEHEGEKTSD